jgi:23S rRNA (cytosine1962-C5)-methyltransferase
MNYCKILLKPKKEESLLRFHPWVFSGAIASITGKPEEGDLVEVYSATSYPTLEGAGGGFTDSVEVHRATSSSHPSKGEKFLGIGHYQIGSIAVRILSFQPAIIDKAFWVEKIRTAYDLRRALGLAESSDNNTYRLIHGEGDQLPGLIIDIYGQTAVIQAHSVGMHHARKTIAEALKEVSGNALQHIYYKSEGTLPFKAALENENEYLLGGSADIEHIALEKGLQFHIDWEKGQKTGFFVDQRENRLLLEKYASNRSVLNMFCYTGSFSAYAMRGGARLVHSVDSSAKAISLTQKNIELNFPGDPRHQAFAEDAFNFLSKMDVSYDLIILDPPAFAKHQNVLRNALQGYRKLNAIALEKIRPGGILFTFSCSQVVSKTDFRLTVFSAAAQSGRNVRILHQLTQPADHPINIYHPEGEYLKGLVLYVV